MKCPEIINGERCNGKIVCCIRGAGEPQEVKYDCTKCYTFVHNHPKLKHDIEFIADIIDEWIERLEE